MRSSRRAAEQRGVQATHGHVGRSRVRGAEGREGTTSASSSASESRCTRNSSPPRPRRPFMLAAFVEGDDGDGARDSSTSGPLVDVHGLSTVETRAAVLSVLRRFASVDRAASVSGDLVIVPAWVEGARVSRTQGRRRASGARPRPRGSRRTGNAGRLVARGGALAWLDRGARSGGRRRRTH